ncbi:hypothetical protein R1sor_009915 [Riccia sorocarpa]|uniref:Uncharacterized protein n=1 Tax=Riccia sorocarpa TaxID=122646 RepID=A0ABD3I2J5_9MARC
MYQGSKGATTAPNAQQVKPGQVANLRPAANSIPQLGGRSTPPRLPMDYRAALNNASYMENDTYDYYAGDYMGGQTQAVVEALDWRQIQAHLAQGQTMNNEAEDATMDADDHTQSLNDETEHLAEESPQRDPGKEKGPATIPDIPESTEDESEDEEEDDEIPEESYIERHKAWVEVLDQMLQRTRKNPATQGGEW